MPFTTAQLATGAFYTLETHRKNDPIDQVNQARPYLDYLLRHKEASTFGNGYHNENIYKGNDSNYQSYFGADQVTFNERDPVRQAKFQWYNHHDGFWFDEDSLAANGIILSDDGSAMPTIAEKEQLADLLKVSYTALKEGTLENLTIEALRDGSQSTKAAPGLDHLVKIAPATGVVGGLDPATATYWRNNVETGVAAANAIDAMERQWRACIRYGGQAPDFIVSGAAFLDNYRNIAGGTGAANGHIQRQIVVPEKGGVGLDASVSGLYFKGVPIVHDHAFEDMDVIDAAATPDWTKRCYFLNSKTGPKLRPMKNFWMKQSKPDKLPDRYVTYFGHRSKYAFTINKRRGQSLIAIA